MQLPRGGTAHLREQHCLTCIREAKPLHPIQLHSHWCSPPAWNTTKAGLQQQQDMVGELLGTGGCTGAMLRADNLVLVLVITS